MFTLLIKSSRFVQILWLLHLAPHNSFNSSQCVGIILVLVTLVALCLAAFYHYYLFSVKNSKPKQLTTKLQCLANNYAKLAPCFILLLVWSLQGDTTFLLGFPLDWCKALQYSWIIGHALKCQLRHWTFSRTCSLVYIIILPILQPPSVLKSLNRKTHNCLPRISRNWP